MGNAFADGSGRAVFINVTADAVKSNLDEFFHPDKLLRSDSDILPLRLFDHQIEGHALLVEARYRERTTHYWLDAAEEGTSPPTESLGDVLAGTETFFDKFVRYLLFAEEASIAGTPVTGSGDFKQEFLAKRRANGDGHSLRDFNLETRLFENRLSYLVYSEAFEGAPRSMKNRVHDRLWTILSPETPPAGYDYFDPGERACILDILRATKDDLPAQWDTEAAISVAATSTAP